MRVVVEMVNVEDSDIPAGKILGRYLLNVDRWDVNSSFGDSTFTFAFAEGVNVSDRIRGTSYQAAQ